MRTAKTREAIAATPFIAGTQVQWAWDSTSLSWLQECPRKYKYAMIDGWRPKADSIHLFYGQVYHSALELFDRLRFKGYDFNEAQRRAVQFTLQETWIDGKPWASDHDKKNRETLVRSVIWYLEHFKDDPAKTVALADGQPAVELSFQMQLDYGFSYGEVMGSLGEVPYQPYVLCGHIDRIVTFADELYITDRKTTTSSLTSRYFDGFKPHTQMSNYTIAGKVVYSIPVKGVMIDAAQILIGSTNFGRGITYRTPDELEEHLDELNYWFTKQREFAEGNYWPHNPQACHKYDGCQFRRVCAAAPGMRKRLLESDFKVEHWNPLEPRTGDA